MGGRGGFFIDRWWCSSETLNDTLKTTAATFPTCLLFIGLFVVLLYLVLYCNLLPFQLFVSVSLLLGSMCTDAVTQSFTNLESINYIYLFIHVSIYGTYIDILQLIPVVMETSLTPTDRHRHVHWPVLMSAARRSRIKSSSSPGHIPALSTTMFWLLLAAS